MPLNIRKGDVVERPVIASGRAGTSVLPELIEEVKPLIVEAMQLGSDKALPLVVPAEEINDLVRALRAAAELENVTVRFKRFPRIGDDGATIVRTRGEGEQQTTAPVTDPFEDANKSGSNKRVTFWTTRKVIRKPAAPEAPAA